MRTEGQDIVSDAKELRTLLRGTTSEIDEKEDEGEEKIEKGNDIILYGFIISLMLFASGFLGQSSVSKAKDEYIRFLNNLSKKEETQSSEEVEEEPDIELEEKGYVEVEGIDSQETLKNKKPMNLNILKKRLVTGEIDIETYKELKKEIE